MLLSNLKWPSNQSLIMSYIMCFWHVFRELNHFLNNVRLNNIYSLDRKIHICCLAVRLRKHAIIMLFLLMIVFVGEKVYKNVGLNSAKGSSGRLISSTI